MPRGVYRRLSVSERFWSKVDKTSSPNGCWLWTRAVRSNKGPYGAFWLNGRHQPASRVAWILTNGSIPNDKQAMHNCPGGDNPRCCNPSHLILGTPKEHGRDKSMKGQLPTGDNHHARKNPQNLARGDRSGPTKYPERMLRGADHGMSVLTDSQVINMRILRKKGYSLKRLAIMYKTDLSNVHLITTYQTWKHLP